MPIGMSGARAAWATSPTKRFEWLPRSNDTVSIFQGSGLPLTFVAHGFDNVAESYIPRPEPLRIALQGNLLRRAAHGRDLCDSRNLHQLVAQQLVL